jgi:ADP-L-glycero-D-manno-heptose 6-epimerase
LVLLVARFVAAGGRRPPQWAGLKFFNVYGPNEYHKRGMASLIKAVYDAAQAGQAPRLYRSDRPEVADGGHRRDFIFVDDVVAVLLWLMDAPSVSGLFNVGTGQARCTRDLVRAVCDAAGVAQRVAFVEMPAALRGNYAPFTQAEIGRLRAAGYQDAFTSLEDGVRRYVRQFLAQADRYR